MLLTWFCDFQFLHLYFHQSILFALIIGLDLEFYHAYCILMADEVVTVAVLELADGNGSD